MDTEAELCPETHCLGREPQTNALLDSKKRAEGSWCWFLLSRYIYLQPYSCRILLSHCEIFTWKECLRSMNWIERMLLNHFCLSFHLFPFLLLRRLEVIEWNCQVITISLGFCRTWKKLVRKRENSLDTHQTIILMMNGSEFRFRWKPKTRHEKKFPGGKE